MIIGSVQIQTNWSEHVLSSLEPNVTVSDLLHDLFVNEWSTEVNYEQYFNECAPSFCTYTKTNRINFSYTFTLFISLYGGLTILFRLISPWVIRILFNCCSRNTTSMCGTRSESKFSRAAGWEIFDLVVWRKRVYKASRRLKRLNLFKNADKRTEHDTNQQRINTRLYISLVLGRIRLLTTVSDSEQD